jgi:hypothetical protein
VRTHTSRGVVGPYAAEEPTIARLHSFVAENGYTPRGRHHEAGKLDHEAHERGEKRERGGFYFAIFALFVVQMAFVVQTS